MKQKLSSAKLDPRYVELCEEDRKYGEKKLDKTESEMRDRRRPLKNLKKAWMEHIEDFDEVDEFFEH